MSITFWHARQIGRRARLNRSPIERALWLWCFDESAQLTRDPGAALREADATTRLRSQP